MHGQPRRRHRQLRGKKDRGTSQRQLKVVDGPAFDGHVAAVTSVRGGAHALRDPCDKSLGGLTTSSRVVDPNIGGTVEAGTMRESVGVWAELKEDACSFCGWRPAVAKSGRDLAAQAAFCVRKEEGGAQALQHVRGRRSLPGWPWTPRCPAISHRTDWTDASRCHFWVRSGDVRSPEVVAVVFSGAAEDEEGCLGVRDGVTDAQTSLLD